MRAYLFAGTAVAFSIFAACGGSTPPAGVASTEPLTPWPQLDDGQRLERMKTVVVPRMKAVFQEHDAEHFAEFGCQTCHGAGAKQGRFKMPNPALPALNPTDGFKAHMDEHRNVTKFMMEQVVPEMAGALGESPFDPKTGEGFGCFECHTKAP
jgi:hypothetical protein